jgi:hypothetical protein
MSTAFFRGAVGPLLVVGLAAALWLMSDRLLYVGPLDRATFGWLVVIPVWALAPAAVGLAGHDLTDIPRTTAALVDGLVVGAIVGGLLWWSAVTVDCLPTHTPTELAPPAIVLGAISGGAFAFACQIAGGQAANGHPWRAVALGAIPQLLVLATVPILDFYLFLGLCQRPLAG